MRLRESFPDVTGGVAGLSMSVCVCCSCCMDEPQQPSEVYTRILLDSEGSGAQRKGGHKTSGRKSRRAWEPHHTLSLGCSCKYWGQIRPRVGTKSQVAARHARQGRVRWEVTLWHAYLCTVVTHNVSHRLG